MYGRSGERSRIGMALIPTSSERLGRFPPIWGRGGASAKNGGDLAERGEAEAC